MPDDRSSISGAPHGIEISRAFAGLPLEAPISSAWPAMVQAISSAPRRPRSRWPLALAATLVVGVAILAVPREASTPATVAQSPMSLTPASRNSQLVALMSQSAQLERLVAVASDDGTSSASTAALSIALEDGLKGVDGELSKATDPAQQVLLWQQRVDLLRDVARIETSRHYLAAQGKDFDVALVAAY